MNIERENGATASETVASTTKSPHALGILLVVCYTIFFGVLNASAIGVVLPDIAAELDIEFSQASWLMTGFLLVYGVAIPFYGRLADIYGARSLFILGAALFALGSLLSAFAPKASVKGS